MSKEEKKQSAIERLIAAGAKLEKKEDRFGETRSGWWMDDVWLSTKRDPQTAIESLGIE